MKKSKRVCLVLSSMLILMLAGCWDRVEIEERGFVLGAAIDVAEEQMDDKLQLTLTEQIVVPSGLGTPTGGGSKKKAYMNIGATGHSLFAINRKLAEKTSRSPYYQHIKMIVVSADVAKKPNLFSSLMDLFIRDHEMRRGIKILITDGEAKNVLDATSDNESLPTIYIESMMENSFKNGAVLRPIRIGKIHGYLVSNHSFAIPKIYMQGDRAVYKNAAVYNGSSKKVVGMLEAKEVKGLNFITGEMEGGVVKTELNEHMTALEILRMNSDMRITGIHGNRVEVTVNINMDAKVAETFSSVDMAKKKDLQILEKNAEKKISKLTSLTLKKTQKELHTDVLGIGQLLKHHHYNYWKKVEDNWDYGNKYFSKSDVKVNVNVNIRATGGADQTSNRGE